MTHAPHGPPRNDVSHDPRRTALALLLAAGCSAVGAAEVKLRILETTDLHMNLLSYDYYQDRRPTSTAWRAPSR